MRGAAARAPCPLAARSALGVRISLTAHVTGVRAAGYTPAKGAAKNASVVRVVLVDRDTHAVLRTLATTPPLGAYSWDTWTAYSPPVPLHAAGVSLANDAPVQLALQIDNRQRNLQIPVDDLAGGFGVKVTWTKATPGAAPARAAAARPAASAAWAVEARAARLVEHDAVGTVDDGAWAWEREESPVVDVGARRVAAVAGVSGQGQLWTKPMPGGGAAALLINASPDLITHAVNLTKLQLSPHAAYRVRDLWAHADLPRVTNGSVPLRVAPFDSAFLLLSPA